jgi:hypothetical protein
MQLVDPITFMIRGDIISITTGYGLDDRRVGVRVLVGSIVFTSSYRPNRLWSPPSFLLNGHGAPSSGVKQQEREADHSTPASAEVNKMWVYTQINRQTLGRYFQCIFSSYCSSQSLYCHVILAAARRFLYLCSYRLIPKHVD